MQHKRRKIPIQTNPASPFCAIVSICLECIFCSYFNTVFVLRYYLDNINMDINLHNNYSFQVKLRSYLVLMSTRNVMICGYNACVTITYIHMWVISLIPFYESRQLHCCSAGSFTRHTHLSHSTDTQAKRCVISVCQTNSGREVCDSFPPHYQEHCPSLQLSFSLVQFDCAYKLRK